MNQSNIPSDNISKPVSSSIQHQEAPVEREPSTSVLQLSLLSEDPLEALLCSFGVPKERHAAYLADVQGLIAIALDAYFDELENY